MCLQGSDIAIQVVATQASLHFYTQEAIDAAVPSFCSPSGRGEAAVNGKMEVNVDEDNYGVRVWTDADEWSVRGLA